MKSYALPIVLAVAAVGAIAWGVRNLAQRFGKLVATSVADSIQNKKDVN